MKSKASGASQARRRAIVTALAVLAVVGLFSLYKFVGEPQMIKYFIGKSAQPAQSVTAQLSETRPWQPTLTAVGTLIAVQGSDLSAEVDGVVREVNFTSGQDVEAGQLLVRLDDEIVSAQLRQREAEATNAQREFERSARLIKQGHVSQSALDAARARRDEANAAVAQAKALLAQKLIVAPFAGRTGVSRVNVGYFVKSGTPIVTVQTLKPIFANFVLPEQALSRVAKGQTVVLTTDTFPDRTFEGTLTSFDPNVDPATRSFLAQATLANADGTLAPGMFARVTLQVGAPMHLVSVPETAISYSLSGDTVFVVGQPPPETPEPPGFFARIFGAGEKKPEPEKTRPVEQRRVELGESRDGWIAIRSGLKEGELVVTAGQLKLYPGATVAVTENNPLSAPAAPSKY